MGRMVPLKFCSEHSFRLVKLNGTFTAQAELDKVAYIPRKTHQGKQDRDDQVHVLAPAAKENLTELTRLKLSGDQDGVV